MANFQPSRGLTIRDLLVSTIYVRNLGGLKVINSSQLILTRIRVLSPQLVFEVLVLFIQLQKPTIYKIYISRLTNTIILYQVYGYKELQHLPFVRSANQSSSQYSIRLPRSFRGWPGAWSQRGTLDTEATIKGA